MSEQPPSRFIVRIVPLKIDSTNLRYDRFMCISNTQTGEISFWMYDTKKKWPEVEAPEDLVATVMLQAFANVAAESTGDTQDEAISNNPYIKT